MSTRSPASILYDENGNPVGVVLDGSVYRLQTAGKIEDPIGQDTMANSVAVTVASDQSDLDVVLKDTVGNPLEVSDAVAIPVGTKGLLISGRDANGAGEARFIELIEDTDDSLFRVAIDGKVSVRPPNAPPNTTSVQIAADTPLSFSGNDDTTYTITNGTTFHVLQVIYGAAGDPTEKGSKIEVLFDDGTEHVITRAYVTGFTDSIAIPDLSEARDGTALTGNGSNTIIVRREHLGGSSKELDAVVLGYEV